MTTAAEGLEIKQGAMLNVAKQLSFSAFASAVRLDRLNISLGTTKITRSG